MRNIAAIADKELRSYFASPIAYILIGFFLLPFGAFFFLYLQNFVEQSLRMGPGGGGMNVNQQVIRYVLQNASVIILFIMPMITMRTYSEEKRSGTVELLLTSPLTDLEIILGKFFGALGLYIVILAVTLLYMAILFVYGNPEWRPLLAGYLGLLLMGAAFISIGVFISSTTNNPNVAGVGAVVVFLLFLVIRGVSRAAADGRRVHLDRAVHLQYDEQPDRRRRGDVRGLPALLDHRLVRRFGRPDDRADHLVAVDHRALR